MSEISRLAEQAPDFQDVLSELITLLHHIALMQKVPDALDLSAEEQLRLTEIAQAVHPEDLQLYYQIALQGRRDLPVAPDMRDAFEMVLLRMLAFTPGGDDGQEVIRAASTAVSDSTPAGHAAAPTSTAKESGAPEARQAETVAPTPAAEPVPPVSHDLSELEDWCALVPQLGITAMVREFANNCRYLRREGNVIVLGLAEAKAHLATNKSQSKIETILSEYFGQALKLTLEITQEEGETPAQSRQRADEDRQKSAEHSMQEDDFVKALGESFDAQIVPGTVKPNQ
jgi:DNA polymerase-3 subunit gamma/tau